MSRKFDYNEIVEQKYNTFFDFNQHNECIYLQALMGLHVDHVICFFFYCNFSIKEYLQWKCKPKRKQQKQSDPVKLIHLNHQPDFFSALCIELK